MATHDYVIDNSTGANVRSDLNNVLQAILTNNSSSSAPSTTAAYMWWADTTTGILKIRNSANDGWVELLQLDGTLTLEDGSASTPALAFRDDLNTGIFSSGADKINFATGGVERLELGGETVFNEDGLNVDFRIEGDSEVNLFYVDAGNDRIGIGTASPTVELDVSGSLRLHSGGATRTLHMGPASAGIEYNVNGTTFIQGRTDAFPLAFKTNSTERMRIDSSGRLLLGTTSARTDFYGSLDADLQVEGSSYAAYSVYAVNGNGAFIFGASNRTNNSTVGNISWMSDDGTDEVELARIGGQIDGTPGSNDMPGRIVFSTTADGASSVTERMRIKSNGRVGIGTTTPNSLFEISGSGNTTLTINTGNDSGDNSQIAFGDNSDFDVGFINYDHGTNVMQFAVAASERMRLDSNGRLHIGNTGINATSSSDDLTVGDLSGDHGISIFSATDSAGFICFGDTDTTGVGSRDGTIRYQQSDNSMRFATNGNNERVRIHSAGELSLQTTSLNLQGGGASDFMFTVLANTGSNHNAIMAAGVASGHGAFTTRPSDAHQYFAGFFLENGGGGVGSISVSTTATTFNTTSDYRLKENAVNISDGITRLKQLLPKRFNWIADETNTLQDGFFAHEVSAIVPEAVTGEKDAVATEDGGQFTKGEPIYQQMDHSKLVPLLVAAVKELITKVEALEAA